MFETLENIISPLSIADFCENYLSRQAVHIRKSPDKFSDLFTWETLNRIISGSVLSLNNLSLYRSGIEDKMQTSDFTVSKILNACSTGSTLHIRSIDEFDEDMHNYFVKMALELKALIKVNMYASPPENQALNLHFDDHEIFVLQVEGKKRWQVYQPITWKNDRPLLPETSYIDVCLEPGDVLYLPIGHWHKALAETPSIHLAVATYWTRGINFSAWLLEKLRPDLTDLFPLLAADNQEKRLSDWQPNIDQINRLISEKLNDQSLNDEFYREAKVKIHDSTNFNFPYHFIEQPFNDFRNLNFYRTEANEAVITDDGAIFLLNYQFNFEQALVPLLKFIFKNNFFNGNDLLKLDPVITDEQITKTLTLFLKEGIITFDDNEKYKR